MDSYREMAVRGFGSASVFTGGVAVGAILISGLALYFWSGSDQFHQKSADAFRVGTVNLSAQNRQPDEVAKALKKVHADLLLLQEWTGQNATLPTLRKARLDVVLSDARRGTHGAALLAKPGIVREAKVSPPPWRGPCAMPLVTALVEIEGKRFGVLGVHGPPPVPGCPDSRVPYLKAVASLVEEGRAAQRFGAVPTGMPILLLGDLNALSVEAPIQRLTSSGLKDASSTGALDYNPTWSPRWWMPRLLPLDYVLVPKSVVVQSAGTASIPGSDHSGLFVDLSAR